MSRVALFYVKNVLACHYALFGYRETLERMGHEVLDCAFPQNAVQNWNQVAVPPIEELMKCDVVLSTYHEYTQPWLEKIYNRQQWQKLMEKVPVLARFDESMDRGDLWLPHRLPVLKLWATHYSFPAAQDAEHHGGEWLPYGADTTIFHPERKEVTAVGVPMGVYRDIPTQKEYPIAFLGTLYKQRAEYLQKLLPHLGSSTTFFTGNCFVQDLPGIHERDTTERLAMNYRKINIFFCLPPMSRLIVEKVFDVMACDTMVMYPRFPDDARRNMKVFEDEKHIVYYDLGFFSNNGKQVKYYLQHPETVQRIARAGGEYVRSKYTLEKMLQAMLDQVGAHREIADKVRV